MIFSYSARWATRLNGGSEKMDISPISDEGCMLNVAWKVMYFSKR